MKLCRITQSALAAFSGTAAPVAAMPASAAPAAPAPQPAPARELATPQQPTAVQTPAPAPADTPAPKPATAPAPQGAQAAPQPSPAVKEQAQSTPQTAPQTAPQAAPQAAPSAQIPHSGGLSLKDMQMEFSKPTVVKDAAVSTTEVPASKEVEITLESILEVWHNITESVDKANLKAALAATDPTWDAETGQVHFEVKNTAQKDWIDKYRRQAFENTLRQSLGTQQLRLVIDVAEVVEDNTPKLYMQSDKEKYLLQTSEEFRNLKKNFELEVN